MFANAFANKARVRTGLRHCLGLATATPTLATLRALHTTTRVQSTLVTHAARVRASPATHVLSHGNTRSYECVLVSMAID